MSHHDHDHVAGLSRRNFLRFGGLGLASALAAGVMPGVAIGAVPGAGQKTVVFLFQRGGADALNLFPPAADTTYANVLRPGLKINSPSVTGASSAIDFIGQWKLHPLMASLAQIPNIAFAPSVAFEEANRSHFDCQKFIERGSSFDNGDNAGIFNKYLQIQQPPGAMQGLAAGALNAPNSLFGPAPTVAINSLETFKINNGDFAYNNNDDAATEKALRTMLTQAQNDQSAVGLMNRAEIAMLDAIAIARATVANPAAASTQNYSSNSQGRGLRLVAQLLKANVPVSVAALDWENTWDSHSGLPTGANSTNVAIGYNANVKAGADDLLAFYNDLGPDMMKNVLVIVGSEFGRTMAQNGTGGADHGIGGAWFAFGGSVAPGHNLVAGSDYSLAAQVPKTFTASMDLYIPFQINCKDLIGEAMVKHLGLPQSQLATIFPGHSYQNNNLLVG